MIPLNAVYVHSTSKTLVHETLVHSHIHQTNSTHPYANNSNPGFAQKVSIAYTDISRKVSFFSSLNLT